jgi:nucleoside-diphosphate-sugar epimerase
LSELPSLEAAPTIVLHLAFLTKDRAEAMDEDEYSRANRAVSKHVLDSLDRIGAQAVFVASSGAAAYADDATAAPAMRLYGALKREEEVAFSQWAEQRGRRAVVCRLFALSGPYINKHQNYALASFIIDALARRPITVRASRPVLRGYVAIREVMSLAFAMLLESERGVVRFETGGAPMEMQAIAEEISAQLGPVPVHRPQVADGDRDEYLGNHDDYRRILSDYGVESVTFAQQVTETAAFFLSEKERMRVASTGAAC